MCECAGYRQCSYQGCLERRRDALKVRQFPLRPQENATVLRQATVQRSCNWHTAHSYRKCPTCFRTARISMLLCAQGSVDLQVSHPLAERQSSQCLWPTLQKHNLIFVFSSHPTDCGPSTGQQPAVGTSKCQEYIPALQSA